MKKKVNYLLTLPILLPSFVHAAESVDTSAISEIFKLTGWGNRLDFLFDPNLKGIAYFARLGEFVYSLFVIIAWAVFVFKFLMACWNYVYKFSNGAPAWQLADIKSEIIDPLKGLLILTVGVTIIKILANAIFPGKIL